MLYFGLLPPTAARAARLTTREADMQDTHTQDTHTWHETRETAREAAHMAAHTPEAPTSDQYAAAMAATS